ncbi:hypothetical protein NBO_53g0007 [Nosema bombycis CQ1]|uniref:Uncharacterized protein n=1 Tax=Nosema bombycis (strain CQ1 / CVCC 102059) TaxID=578461 RepID=R0KUL2_NOSB1|nr:hypothetical protein NBO_53g0007 [Nosema bombycis CQ1]|eukprot:EOB13882.1 hypothetical protein NBO_53g0007 [Nosema bombycis CQ1]
MKLAVKNYDFSHLKVLKDIIAQEKNFKIQIISLEPIDLFLEFLNINSYKYVLLVNSRPSKSHINIQIEYEDIDVNRIILYNNKRNLNFIQIVFKLTRQEKTQFLKGKVSGNIDLLLDMYPYKNTNDLINIAQGYSLDIPNIMKDSLDYTESIILLSMIRHTKLGDIVSNIKLIDQSLDNVFMIRNKILNLLDRKIISCYKDNYKINISHESLKKILERIDFDINRT